MAYIAERDTDFALMREINLSSEVQQLFLEKVNEKGSLLKVLHSLVEEEQAGKLGESDVVLVFERPNETRFAIFVEDKIAASPQPEQRERYELRAVKFVEKMKLDRHYVVLFAPQEYLNREPSRKYDLRISHESVADLCIDELDKQVFIDSCKAKQSAKKRIDLQITGFWNETIDYIGEHHKDLLFKSKKVDRGPNSKWLEFGTSIKSIKIIYKNDQNVVDLTFNRMAGKRSDVIAVFEEMHVDLGDRYFFDTSASLALRKDLHRDLQIDFRKTFESQKGKMESIIDEVYKMAEMIKKIGNSKCCAYFDIGNS